jgi:hypothetical protein
MTSAFPAPPIYRPYPPREAVQMRRFPARPLILQSWAIQRMEDDSPAAAAAPPGSSNVAEDNLLVMHKYRHGFMEEVEDAFQRAGYSIDNMRAATLKALRAWGQVIPGHGTSSANKDSGEQGQTGPMCEKAKAFLISWAASNPHGAKATPTVRVTEERRQDGIGKRLQKREDKKREKVLAHREGEKAACQHPRAAFGYCIDCGASF